MKPILTLPTCLIAVPGNSVRPSAPTTLAARYWNPAPANGSTAQGWRLVYFSHPPFCMRSSSAEPLSNSWLPTDANSSPAMLSALIVGSSRNSAELIGLAPIKSPAATVTLFGVRSCFSALAR